MKFSLSSKITIFSLLLIAIILIVLVVQNKNNATVVTDDIINITATGDVVKGYASVKELYEDATLVAQVEATSINSLSYSDVAFTITEGKIEKMLKGEYKANDVISILETGGITELKVGNKTQMVNVIFEENNVFRLGEKAIVFLKKYVGPVADDSYVVLGAYQGKFLIDGDKVVPPAQGNVEVKHINDLNIN